MKNYHLHLRGFVGGYDFDSRHVQNDLLPPLSPLLPLSVITAMCMFTSSG